MSLGIHFPAALAGGLLGLMAVLGIASEVARLTDPCFTWGMSEESTTTVSPGTDCPSRGATTETRAGAMLRLALFNGTLLLAAGLMLATLRWGGPAPFLFAALLLMLISVPLLVGAFAAVTLWCFAVCVIGAHERVRDADERTLAHAFALVAGLAGLYFGWAVVQGIVAANWRLVLFQALLALPLLGCALVVALAGRLGGSRAAGT